MDPTDLLPSRPAKPPACRGRPAVSEPDQLAGGQPQQKKATAPKIRKRVQMGTAMILVALLSMLVTPQPASADVYRYSWAPDGYVGMKVFQDGNLIKGGVVQRNKYSGWICYYGAALIAYPPTGGQIWLGGYQSRSGCSFRIAWFQFNDYRRLPWGTTICGYFWEDHGQLRAGVPCYRV